MHDGAGIALQFTFPDCYDAPALLRQILDRPPVALDRPLKLREPEVRACAGRGGVSAPWMTVPVAAMNEDDGPVARQNEVRLAGQGRRMQAIPETGAVQQGAEMLFRVPYPCRGYGTCSSCDAPA